MNCEIPIFLDFSSLEMHQNHIPELRPEPLATLHAALSQALYLVGRGLAAPPKNPTLPTLSIHSGVRLYFRASFHRVAWIDPPITD